MDINTMITTYNTAMTGAASEIFGNEYRRKMPWVTRDVLDLFDERRLNGMKQKEQNQEDSEGSEESKRGLDRYQGWAVETTPGFNQWF